MRQNSLYIGHDERMRHIVECRTLRLKQRTHVEGMAVQVKHARLATFIKAGDAQTTLIEERGIARIEAKATMVLFGNLAFAINSGNARAGLQDDVVARLDQRAGERSNQWQRRLRVRFGMICLSKVEDVTRIFDQGMLEAATGAEKGNSALTSKADREQCPFHTLIRAGRHDP